MRTQHVTLRGTTIDTQTGESVTLVFTGEYTPADPGCFSGAPDNWCEPSPAEFAPHTVQSPTQTLGLTDTMEAWDALLERYSLADDRAWMNFIDSAEIE